MMIRLSLSIALLFVCAAPAQASEEEELQLTRGEAAEPADPRQRRPRPTYKVTEFGAEDGVPSRTVRGLSFDSDGLLWLGTNGGVATFDGLEFKALRAAETEGLATNRILSVSHTSNGDLWFGSDRGPLVRHRDGQFESFKELEGLTDVTQIIEATDGTVWFFGRGIASFKDEQFAMAKPPPGIQRFRASRAIERQDGTILAASNIGLLEVEHAEVLQVLDPRPLSWLLLGFEDDVWLRDAESGCAYPMGGTPQEDMFMDLDVIHDELDLGGSRRLVAADRGLLILKPPVEDGDMPEFVLLRNDEEEQPQSLARGVNGEIWMGTARDGLRYMEKSSGVPVPLEGDRDDDQRSVQWVFSVGGEQMLATTADQELTALVDGYGGRVMIPNPTSFDGWITGACSAPNGQILVATKQGLGYLEGETIRFLPGYEGIIEGLGRSPDGTIWYSEGPLVKEFLPNGGEPRVLGPFNVSAKGFWVTETGILRADYGVLERAHYNGQGVEVVCDLPEVLIRGVFQSADGATWVTTYGDGLLRVRADGELHRWSVSAGLPDPFLGWVGDPSGGGGMESLWLNSNSGTICVDVASLESLVAGDCDTIKCRLDVGPEGNGSSGAVLPNGYLALPTVEGLRVIDTDRVNSSRPPPPTLIHSVEANGMPWDEDLRLRGAATLSYSFAALVFPSARGARYRYRLSGFDDDWVNAGEQRAVRFTNLPPGDYNFEVQSRAADSDWSPPVSVPTISVAKTWYQRWDVRLLMALAALGLLWAIYAKRTRAIRQRNEELGAEVERRRVVERALREVAESYANTLETAIDGIVTCDIDGTVNYVNPALERILGVHSSDVEGQSVRILDVVGESGGLDRIIDGIQSGEANRAETVMAKARHSDGTTIELEMTVGRAGPVGAQRLVCVVRDVGERMRMSRQLERLRGRVVKAEESERSRIARELHDDLSQRLAALAMDAQVVRAGVTQVEGTKVPGAMKRIREGLETVAVDVHALSRRLHPTVVDDLGLARALRSECKQRRLHGDMAVEFVDETEGVDIPNAVGLSFFRIAQESMRNAERHAAATSITVKLSILSGSAVLSITDDGVGFDMSRTNAFKRGGIGLVSMQERAKFVHGYVAITSQPGQGTEVKVTAPLAPATLAS